MRFLPGNAQHIGARHSQQDSFGFADPDDASFIQHGGFLAVVCDGMGGMEYGDLAGRTAVRAFLEAYGRKTPQESVPAALDRSVREANARVVALAHSLGRAEGIGTTLVAATLLEGGPGQARLYWVSVGDSGLFLARGGQMRMMNRPHVFANQLDQAVARGTMSLEAAMTHPERESLTSFIGAEVLEEIDLTAEPMMLAEGDTILLASDGMFKTLSPAEITLCLSGHPQNWPDTLVGETLARRKEAQDNVTVLSVTVEGDPINVLPASGTFVRPPEFAPPPSAAQAEAQAGQQTARTVRIPPQDTGGPPPAATGMAGGGWPQPAMAPAMGLAPSGLAPTGGRGGGRGWTWILGLILLLGAGGGGWWYWSHKVPPVAPGRARSSGAGTNKDTPRLPDPNPNRPMPSLDPNAPVAPTKPGERQPEINPGGGK